MVDRSPQGRPSGATQRTRDAVTPVSRPRRSFDRVLPWPWMNGPQTRCDRSRAARPHDLTYNLQGGLQIRSDRSAPSGIVVDVSFCAARARSRQGGVLSDSPRRVLVLTLFSGEAEYGHCSASLEEQSYSSWVHKTFEHLADAEAHALLYRTIMGESHQYDLFLKLDADMILADREVLADLVQVFVSHQDLDHLVVAVTDWMTESRIIGAHIFSNRVSWRQHSESLYVDPDPEFPGRKIIVEQPSRDLVLHAVDPSPLQAFHFGAHRGLQASQVYRNLRDARPHDARIQWHYLDQVWQHFERTGDQRLGLAVLAADLVFRKELPASVHEYSDSALLAAFVDAENLNAEEIRARLDERWANPTARHQTWIRALGPAKAILVAGRSLRDTAASIVKALLRVPRSTIKIGTRA